MPTVHHEGSRLQQAGRAIAAAGLVIVSILAGLGVIEGATRLFFPVFDPSGQVAFDYSVGPLRLAEPGAELRQVKNTGDFDIRVRIDARGLRDSRDIAQATPSDLVVVGDSFAWGWGVEESQRFSDRVEAMTGIRTFNLSTPTDLDGYLDLLRYAQSLGARIANLVVAVCMENDLHLYAAQSAPPTEAAAQPGSLDAWKAWLMDRSAAYILASSALHRTSWLYRLGVRAGLVVPNLEGIGLNEFSPAMIESSADRLQQIARQYRTLVVLIPSRGLWVGPNLATEDHVHRSLLAALARRGVNVLDLRPLFEARGNPLSFSFANDAHWNDSGHLLAAEAIAGRLQRCKRSARGPSGAGGEMC